MFCGTPAEFHGRDVLNNVTTNPPRAPSSFLSLPHNFLINRCCPLQRRERERERNRGRKRGRERERERPSLGTHSRRRNEKHGAKERDDGNQSRYRTIQKVPPLRQCISSRSPRFSPFYFHPMVHTEIPRYRYTKRADNRTTLLLLLLSTFATFPIFPRITILFFISFHYRKNIVQKGGNDRERLHKVIPSCLSSFSLWYPKSTVCNVIAPRKTKVEKHLAAEKVKS